MTVVLIFGFVAKEIVLGAMAVIYAVNPDNLAGVVANTTTWIQAYSFMLFVLIYTPCLSTVAVLKQESKSWSFTAIAVAWPLFLAWLASFVFYQAATYIFGS
jgi:ferrous iron transport protein B